MFLCHSLPQSYGVKRFTHSPTTAHYGVTPREVTPVTALDALLEGRREHTRRLQEKNASLYHELPLILLTRTAHAAVVFHHFPAERLKKG